MGTLYGLYNYVESIRRLHIPNVSFSVCRKPDTLVNNLTKRLNSKLRHEGSEMKFFMADDEVTDMDSVKEEETAAAETDVDDDDDDDDEDVDEVDGEEDKDAE